MPDPEHRNNSAAEPSPRAVADSIGVATEEFKISMPIGIGAVLAALASLATCYSGILLTYLVGYEALSINPHAQAVLMWVFALLAVTLSQSTIERVW